MVDRMGVSKISLFSIELLVIWFNIGVKLRYRTPILKILKIPPHTSDLARELMKERRQIERSGFRTLKRSSLRVNSFPCLIHPSS